MKRRLSGDEDLDKYYLQGEPDYQGIFYLILICIGLLIYFIR